MSNIRDQNDYQSSSTLYQIRIKGSLIHQVEEKFEGFSMTEEEDGDTLLTGTIIDQAALHGLLKKVRDLGMTLVSINSIDTGKAKKQEIKP